MPIIRSFALRLLALVLVLVMILLVGVRLAGGMEYRKGVCDDFDGS